MVPVDRNTEVTKLIERKVREKKIKKIQLLKGKQTDKNYKRFLIMKKFEENEDSR